MRPFLIILILAGVFFQEKAYSQRTFTLKPNCISTNPFTTPSCWDVTGSCGSGTSPSISPSGTAACPVEIIISGNTQLNGDLTLGGYVTITVSSGANLEITGSIIVKKETQGNYLETLGGTITASEISLESGKSSANTSLGIKGDGLGRISVMGLEINQNVGLDILEGGDLQVTGTTNYSGNSSQINVYGEFETQEVIIAGGGKGVELNAYGNSNVKILGDLEIRGESTIEFGGNSNINVSGNINVNGNSDLTSETGGLFLKDSASLTVGGDINVDGNAAVVIENEAEVLVAGSVYLSGSGQFNMSENSILIVEGGCGTYEDVNCNGGLFISGNAEFNESELAQAYICGQKPEPNTGSGSPVKVTVYCIPGDPNSIPGVNCALYTSCRILAVEFDKPTVSYDLEKKVNIIRFVTKNERDNSHFILERSVDGTKTFLSIRKINGSGWSNSEAFYELEDNDLPIAGGNIFYRIKQVDFNGGYVYSEVFANRIPGIEFSRGVWRAYPNPIFNSDLSLGLLDPKNYSGGEISVRIVHPLQTTDFFTSSALEAINYKIRTWITTLPSGVFILEVQWDGKMDQIKILKQN
jgi:hypothetical protein